MIRYSFLLSDKDIYLPASQRKLRGLNLGSNDCRPQKRVQYSNWLELRYERNAETHIHTHVYLEENKDRQDLTLVVFPRLSSSNENSIRQLWCMSFVSALERQM